MILQITRSITSTLSCLITSSRLRRPKGRSERQCLTRQFSYGIFFYIRFISRIDGCRKKCLPYDGVRYKNHIRPPHLPSGAKNPRRSSYVIDDASDLGKAFFPPDKGKQQEFIYLIRSLVHLPLFLQLALCNLS